MTERNLSLKVGDGQPSPVRNITDITFGDLRTIRPLGIDDQPLDEPVEITPSDRMGLSRFLNVRLFDELYRAFARELTGEEHAPSPDAEVSFEIEARRVDDGTDPETDTDLLDFDITLRGALSPELLAAMGLEDGDALDLLVTLRVRSHQLTEHDPQYLLRLPRLQ
jgi:hypothetical protein